jgi:hypothetical protein
MSEMGMFRQLSEPNGRWFRKVDSAVNFRLTTLSRWRRIPALATKAHPSRLEWCCRSDGIRG